MYNNEYEINYDEVLVSSGIRKVILWMILGLFATGMTMISVLTVPAVQSLVVQTYRFIWIPAIVVGISLSAGINKISLGTARIMFIVYSILVGFMLSTIFFVYDSTAILLAFSTTIVIFSVMGIYGYATKEDLSKYSRLLFVALISLVIMSVINIFFKSPALYWIISYAGVIIFTALIGYDMQKIKRSLIMYSNGDTEMLGKVSIIGALQLYLDFINLFIYLLRIFGKKK